MAIRTIPVPAPRPDFSQPAASPAQDRAAEKAPIEVSASDRTDKAEKPPASRSRETSAPQGDETLEARLEDPISKLLKAHSGGAPSSPEPARTVLAAQRALAKLGLAVKVDGIAGAETRRAIERYEHARKLPVRGELTPKILRRLSVESGITID